jgi:hypothetical protein
MSAIKYQIVDRANLPTIYPTTMNLAIEKLKIIFMKYMKYANTQPFDSKGL